MSRDHLSEARDLVELSRLLHDKLARESVPRDQIRSNLATAKAHIDIHLDEMDRTDALLDTDTTPPGGRPDE